MVLDRDTIIDFGYINNMQNGELAIRQKLFLIFKKVGLIKPIFMYHQFEFRLLTKARYNFVMRHVTEFSVGFELQWRRNLFLYCT